MDYYTAMTPMRGAIAQAHATEFKGSAVLADPATAGLTHDRRKAVETRLATTALGVTVFAVLAVVGVLLIGALIQGVAAIHLFG